MMKSCFMVTATMGNKGHPVVTDMRKFRDDYPANFRPGGAFVSWYYKEGPKLANFIGKSRVRRFLSYLFVVKPASLIANYLYVFRK